VLPSDGCLATVVLCRTTTAAADAETNNDVMDADRHDVVGRYARYDEVTSTDCDLLPLFIAISQHLFLRGSFGRLSQLVLSP